jgi:hypothetical protein
MYYVRCANLEALAALDEGVGDPEESVVTEVQHAQELQVLKLASREDGGEVVPQLVVTVGQGEQVQLKIFVGKICAIFVANPTSSFKMIKIFLAHFLLFTAVIMNYNCFRSVNPYLAYDCEESGGYKEMSSILADQ